MIIPSLSEVRAEIARRRLREFVKVAWPNIEPGREYIHNWHIDAVCDHLQAVVAHASGKPGGIPRLILNYPPRHMKSLTSGVALPTWAWIDHPHLQFMYASYAQSLSVRDSIKCRRLIQSPWYQKYYGDRFQLTGDQNQKQRYDNDRNGYRLATSVDGALTGEGGDIICLPYEQVVRTMEGDLPIGEVVETKKDVPVLSFNHLTGATEWKPICTWQTNPARPLVEIELEDGRCFTCTEDHAVFVEGRGYVPAKDVTEDDVVLVELSDGLSIHDNAS